VNDESLVKQSQCIVHVLCNGVYMYCMSVLLGYVQLESCMGMGMTVLPR